MHDIQKEVTIKTQHFKIIAVTGFARPACLLAYMSCSFNSTISILYQGKTVNLKSHPSSILDIMSLEIKPGTYFTISAEGIDEEIALKAIEKELSKNLFFRNWIMSNVLWGLVPEGGILHAGNYFSKW
ncbi:HPr family phosphocarrier protein [Niallia taxi]|uniref:HPr family phosphocarrier protein n=1 Tax=Niallia taxi TaxID=2499688 RepID=UPI002E227F83|nr:HPr family phosphocarrier protein [Niallia taxi]